MQNLLFGDICPDMLDLYFCGCYNQLAGTAVLRKYMKG